MTVAAQQLEQVFSGKFQSKKQFNQLSNNLDINGVARFARGKDGSILFREKGVITNPRDNARVVDADDQALKTKPILGHSSFTGIARIQGNKLELLESDKSKPHGDDNKPRVYMSLAFSRANDGTIVGMGYRETPPADGKASYREEVCVQIRSNDHLLITHNVKCALDSRSKQIVHELIRV